MNKIIIILSVLFVFIFSSFLYAENTGHIQIECKPGVSIFLDGDFQGETSSEFGGIILQDVKKGEHKIKAVKKGFNPTIKKVFLKGGDVHKITIEQFEPKLEITQEGQEEKTGVEQKTGTLVIHSLPIECKLSIPELGILRFQKEKGKWKAESIPEGEYQIKGEALNIKLYKKVKVRGNEKTILTFNFIKKVVTIIERVVGRDGAYIAYANGIVKDSSTGLEWKVGPDRDISWDEAKEWVEELDIDGGGWRLPTNNELFNLCNANRGTRNMTPLLKTTGWFVWSGETSTTFINKQDRPCAYGLLFGKCEGICMLLSYDGNEARAFAVRSRGNG